MNSGDKLNSGCVGAVLRMNGGRGCCGWEPGEGGRRGITHVFKAEAGVGVWSVWMVGFMRRSWEQQAVKALQKVSELILDQAAYFEGLKIVFFVVLLGKNVRTEKNGFFDFQAKSFAAGADINVFKGCDGLGPVTEFDTVKTGKISASFGGGNNAQNQMGQVELGQIAFADICAQFTQTVYGCVQSIESLGAGRPAAGGHAV